MKKIRYAVFFIILAALQLCAENRADNEWAARKESVKRDKSVVAYYTFEGVEDSSSEVRDLSGNGRNLVFVRLKAGGREIDDLKVIEGRFPGKKAVRLDRGWYQGPPAEIKSRTFSAGCWFRKAGPATEYEGVNITTTTLLLNGGGPVGWTLFPAGPPDNLIARISCVPGTASGRAGRKKSSSISARARGVPLADNEWHHAALTWDGLEIKLYINGILAGKEKHDGEYVPGASSLMIGYNTREIIDIDEVVIYNRVLSALEIEEEGKGREKAEADKLKAIFAAADRLIEKGDFDGARKEYARIEEIPALPFARELALFNTAWSYRLEKKYGRAAETYEKIVGLKGLNANYRAYALFCKAETLSEAGRYREERQVYEEILKIEELSDNDAMRARRGIGDTYRKEKRHAEARDIYLKLLAEAADSHNPNEMHRLELADRLERIDGLADGEEDTCERKRRIERVFGTESSIYVSPGGNDAGRGTEEEPFATLARAQEEVRKIKKESGLPAKGISVYLRGGRYFTGESIIFTVEDSGTEDAPVVYRSYPGEEARIIGGRQVSNFKILDNPGILERLPGESRGKVWTADLKALGITEYGELLNRGIWTGRPGAMELMYEGRTMPLARWPNEGWARVGALVNPAGDGVIRNTPFQVGKFVYSGKRPERWKEESEIWLKGYMGVNQPYILKHWKVSSIDTSKKIIHLENGPKKTEIPRIAANHPYFAYNLLSEIDMEGEWYIDRETGKLYFWPPDGLDSREVIVSTLDAPVLVWENVSNLVLFGLTVEGTWRNAIEVTGGEKNLIAGCTVRNAGQWGIKALSGWGHGIVGCDIYDVGEGGISLAKGINYNLRNASAAEARRKLVPDRMFAENNYIYRFNRFCGGNNPAISVGGIGQRISHNLIADSPHYGISLSFNNNIIEFNEIHDILAHSRELGAIYTWDGGNQLTYRGNVLRNNFLHHLTGHYSPNFTHGARAVHIDGISANLTLSGNVFYRTQGISSSAPDCRYENNIFVDSFPAISQGNRSRILESEGKLNPWGLEALTALRRVDWKQPPWSARYPQLLGALKEDNRPLAWPGNITISRNVNTGGPFLTVSGGIREGLTIVNNALEGDPLFHDTGSLDFRIRPGSPVYGETGFEPLPFEKIGLYEDALRASWPVERFIGKYFDPAKETGEAEQKEYTVSRRKSPVRIDGRLEREEWLGLDKKRAIVFNKYYTASQDREAPESLAWILYDDTHLYMGMEHSPDPWKEGMPSNLKDLVKFRGKTEISIEGRMDDGQKSWWPLDMETGPIYVMNGYSDGKTEILDSYFKIPEELRGELEKNVEYAAVMLDSDKLHWSSEWKIPLLVLNINPEEPEPLRFNIGVRKRMDWAAWMYTGGRIWRLEGGGRLKFAR